MHKNHLFRKPRKKNIPIKSCKKGLNTKSYFASMSGLIKIKLNILDQQQKETKNWFPLKNVANNKVLLFLKHQNHQTDNFALSHNGFLY